MANVTIGDLTEQATPSSDDFIEILDTVLAASRKVTFANMFINIGIVADTSPQLGAILDVNGFALGDGTLELLKFIETASAVNELTITNSATGNAPTLSATGDDTNISLILAGKGTGSIQFSSDLDANDKNVNNVKVAGFNLTDDGNSSTADTIDFSVGAFHKSTLTDDVTYTFTSPFTGGTDLARLQMIIHQDATGGRDATWPANVTWPDGEPTWTDGTSNQKIMVTFIYDDGEDDFIGQATAWYT